MGGNYSILFYFILSEFKFFHLKKYFFLLHLEYDPNVIKAFLSMLLAVCIFTWQDVWDNGW